MYHFAAGTAGTLKLPVLSRHLTIGINHLDMPREVARTFGENYIYMGRDLVTGTQDCNAALAQRANIAHANNLAWHSVFPPWLEHMLALS